MRTAITNLSPGSCKVRIALLAGACALIMSILAACQSGPLPTAITTPQVIATRQPARAYPTRAPVRISTRRPEDALVLSDEELSARWLSGTPCRPPCWEGITPGETTAEDAFDILSANPLFTQVQIDRFPEDRLGYISFFMRSSRLDEGVVIYHDYSTETVFAVYLYGLWNENLGKLIQAFGEPSHVEVGLFPSERGGTINDRWFVKVLWLPQGLALGAYGMIPAPDIGADLPLSGAIYYPPDLEGYQVATDSTEFELYFLKPWHGYDSFEAYIVPTPTPTPAP